VIGNKLYKFGAGFFSSGKAAGSVDTGGINGFWQRGMMEKRQAKCKGYFQALTKGTGRNYGLRGKEAESDRGIGLRKIRTRRRFWTIKNWRWKRAGF
jgi:hypothetical protein